MGQTTLELTLTGITRKCYDCGKEKQITSFAKSSKDALGYAYQCKECGNSYSREYVTEHAEERNLKRKIKYHTDKEWREKEKQRNKKPKDNRLNKPYNERTYEKLYTSVKRRCKYSSKRKAWNFDISLEYALEIAEKQNNKCALTGLPFTFTRTGEKHHDALLPTLDRINSDLGYIPGNIQWANKWANFAKLNFNTDFFHEMCLHAVKNNGNLPEYIKYPIPQVYIETHLEPLEPIEINPKLKHLKNIYNPLRKCKSCGTEAWTEEDLELFKKHNKLLYGRDNICKQCNNKQQREKHPYIKPTYLRKCRVCGLEAHDNKTLTTFERNKRLPHGYDNICKECRNKQDREKRHKTTPISNLL